MFDFIIFAWFRSCVVYNFLDRIAEMSGSYMDEGITARSWAKPVALEKKRKGGRGWRWGSRYRRDRKKGFGIAMGSRPVCVRHMETATGLYCGE